MPPRRIRVAGVGRPGAVPDALAAAWQALRDRLEVPADFPPDVLAEAETAAVSPRLPQLDRTDLGLVTIDPEGARDLDQALGIDRDPASGGYRVHYAIADLGAFVTPGGALDAESHRRGLTFYAPDRRTPLYPSELSEGAASLLPGETRPALLWTIDLDADGEQGTVEVVRARVRSRARLSYPQAQAAVDAGDRAAPDEAIGGADGLRTLRLLAEVGPLREKLERHRGGVSLDLPEQQVERTDDGWRLRFRAPLPVEGWNAQISLLTGMAAAALQLRGRTGALRTLPSADPRGIARLRRTARALRLAWPGELGYPEFVRGLDAAEPADAAMLTACTTLFRGAGYAAFHGDPPEQPEHAAIAAPYAHVTAPLRRLVDRYAGETCLALAAGRPVPSWVLDALDALPSEMSGAERAEHRYEGAVLDLAEAVVLADRVGSVFTGTVVELDEHPGRGRIMIADPAVEARVTGPDLPLGEEIRARLVTADPEQGPVAFEQI